MISVVTVCYNCLDELTFTVNNILEQKDHDFELIIIDGGSNDGSLIFLNSIRDKRVTFISETDNGIYDAMNKGVKLSNGSHVIFMNAGDVFYSDRTLSVINSHTSEFDVIYGDFIADYEYKKVYRKSYCEDLYINSKFKEMGFCHQSLALKRDCFFYRGEFIGFDTSFKVAADFDLMYPILKDMDIKKINISIPVCIFKTGGVSDLNKINSLFEIRKIFFKNNDFSCLADFNFFLLIVIEFFKSKLRVPFRVLEGLLK